MLFAQRNDCALALACSAPWTKRSAGYVGFSDDWQDLKAHHQMAWEYTRAANGNVALAGEPHWMYAAASTSTTGVAISRSVLSRMRITSPNTCQ